MFHRGTETNARILSSDVLPSAVKTNSRALLKLKKKKGSETAMLIMKKKEASRGSFSSDLKRQMM